jgi:hypothetical protein
MKRLNTTKIKRAVRVAVGNTDYVAKLRALAFDKQLAFIDDANRFKSALTSRRGGKTSAAALYLLLTCLEKPRATCFYLTLTIDQAKKNLNRDIMQPFLEAINLEIGKDAGPGKVKFNEVHSSYTFENGSVIYLMGLDSSARQQQKLRGGKYDLVIIDEMQSFSSNTDLEDVIDGNLKFAAMDKKGTIATMGTPGWDETSYWFETTLGNKAKYMVWFNSRYHWTGFDNPHMREIFIAEEANLALINPDLASEPKHQREFYGRWVSDHDKMVYSFDMARNTISEMPDTKHMIHVLGMDPGEVDDFAFVVLAYSPFDHHIYVREVFKSPHMEMDEVVDRIKHYVAKYKVHTAVIDEGGGGKLAVSWLRHKYQLPCKFLAAEKPKKWSYISIMNSDFISGTIKAVMPNCQPLVDEWTKLDWVLKDGKRTERNSRANHLADAALYAFKQCQNWINDTAPPDPASDAEAYELELDRKIIEESEIPWYENF